MYEPINGTARLVRALEAVEQLDRLALLLNYIPEQLRQDIQALVNFYEAHAPKAIKLEGITQEPKPIQIKVEYANE